MFWGDFSFVYALWMGRGVVIFIVFVYIILRYCGVHLYNSRGLFLFFRERRMARVG